jgi:uncharacterized protein (TIGR00730 family)
MWYNNERDRKSIYYADSPDLDTWQDKGKAVDDQGGEGGHGRSPGRWSPGSAGGFAARPGRGPAVEVERVPAPRPPQRQEGRPGGQEGQRGQHPLHLGDAGPEERQARVERRLGGPLAVLQGALDGQPAGDGQQGGAQDEAAGRELHERLMPRARLWCTTGAVAAMLRAAMSQPTPKRICVFCGASPGRDPRHAEAARHLGRTLAARGLGLVYGGGSVGLMGTLADAVLEAGGEAIGVIPQVLQIRELAHRRLTRLEVVGSMHERKALMAELSDGFVALPGGMGTLDELAEIMTWSQLGLHQRPVGLLDVGGYWRPLVDFFDHAEAAGFIRPEHRAMLLVEAEAGPLLDRFAAWRPAAPAERLIERKTS